MLDPSSNRDASFSVLHFFPARYEYKLMMVFENIGAYIVLAQPRRQHGQEPPIRYVQHCLSVACLLNSGQYTLPLRPYTLQEAS
jgi:hypothetical protein